VLLTLNTDVNVILTGGLLVADGVFGFRERIEGLEVLDVRGHETGWTVSLLKRVGVGASGVGCDVGVSRGLGWLLSGVVSGVRGLG
jgi:hypothetical protein